MELLVNCIGCYSGILAPVLAAWAIIMLYVQSDEADKSYAHSLFFAVFMIIATLTVRSTTMVNDEMWLVHAASLGSMIVGGVMRRPADTAETAISNY